MPVKLAANKCPAHDAAVSKSQAAKSVKHAVLKLAFKKEEK